MISFVISFAYHNMLFSSFRVVRAFGRALGYALPYSNLAAVKGNINFNTKHLKAVRAVGRALGSLGYALPYSTMAAVKGNINFNTKHLKAGDLLPPFTGKLRLYNMRYCPYAHRTILALNAKQIDYEVVNIDLIEKPQWLTTKNAFAKVPALEIKNDVCIYESLAIVEYLDDVYPQRPLLLKDPVNKAFDKIIIEAATSVGSLYLKSVKAPDQITEDIIAAYHKALEFIQTELKTRSSKFLDGDEPGFADYMIWPWFERILTVDQGYRIMIEATKYKLLIQWINNMYQDPAVSQYLIPKEIYAKFHQFYADGVRPNYELFNEN